MDKRISASLICADMCNPINDVLQLEQGGCDMLHIDLLDGYFSPSMPLGLETVSQLRKKSSIPFDAHVMAVDNSFFMEQLINIGVKRMCFQVETERHLNRKLSWLKENGIEAGVALAPGTPVSTVECVLEECDFVLLMMINPGYASDRSEVVTESRKKKISCLNQMIESQGITCDITIDGRIDSASITEYSALGATTFVAGTSSLFINNGKSLYDNLVALQETLKGA